MSVKKYSSAPKAVHDCRELLLWIIPQIDKLPRNRRYTLGEKLENRILTVLESLVTAAYAPNKKYFLYFFKYLYCFTIRSPYTFPRFNVGMLTV